jgi:hypothetical protein
MRSPQGSQGGGILSRLLGKGKTARGGFLGMNPMAGGGAAPGGSFLKSFTNPTAISGFLNNTQQVLRAAQQIGPMVSQYGPLMRNLPAMWRLYRGLKDGTVENAEDQDDQSTESKGKDESSSTSKDKKTSSVRMANEEESQDNRSRKRRRRTSATEDRKNKVQITNKSRESVDNKERKGHSTEYDWDDESEDKPIQKGNSIPRLYI